MEFSLLGAAAMAAGALYVVLWWEARRGNAADCSKNLWDLALTAGIVGLFIGRLAAMVLDGVNPVTHLGDVLIVRAGVDTGLASLGALATFAVLARGELRAAADGIAAAAMAGLAGWHAGCLLRDACHGTATDLPWGLSISGSDIARHPVGVYTAALFALASVVLILWKRRVPPLGAVGAAALAASGVIRLVTEPLRPSLGSGPVGWYAAAVTAGAALLIVSALSQRSRRTA